MKLLSLQKLSQDSLNQREKHFSEEFVSCKTEFISTGATVTFGKIEETFFYFQVLVKLLSGNQRETATVIKKTKKRQKQKTAFNFSMLYIVTAFQHPVFYCFVPQC